MHAAIRSGHCQLAGTTRATMPANTAYTVMPTTIPSIAVQTSNRLCSSPRRADMVTP
ncbi:hypothetical protein GGR39_003371 [Novosphingobium fluoreni]|uniref:Uncharacterized protein n=1 Tax=Novosphingobium fluoreni TaxID=1391222 RepID=A0A7W6C3W8_9SPHN|nr:hypothetical protein [Novosphingobium fluoreni]MBB3941690.1 hypothetical protein [Novosphingobium fluoreni]